MSELSVLANGCGIIRSSLEQAYAALADHGDGTPQAAVFDALDALDDVEVAARAMLTALEGGFPSDDPAEQMVGTEVVREARAAIRGAR